MKKLIILILCILCSCSVSHIYETDYIIVTKITKTNNNLCKFLLDVPDTYNDIMIRDSCNCFSVGDTVKIIKYRQK
jgi:uncharacterized membrane protein